MFDDEVQARALARRDFSRARFKAFWQNIWANVTNQDNELLEFDQVTSKLRLHNKRYLGLQNVPLDKIVGSVGRYQDFTRKFLPKKSVSQERWQQVDALARGMRGFPPIELYKIGDAYFVLDGNHRVSVARQLDMPTIEAYVTEMILPAALEIDENFTQHDLFIKAAYLEFLRQTSLNELRPESKVILTEPIMYDSILEHIAVHKYFKDTETGTDHPYEEMVASWYDTVYLPMVEAIREANIMDEFPGRTEADLYVWLIRHQAALTRLYGDNHTIPSPQETAADFKEKLSTK
jgi:hypothetical protein